MAQEKMRNKPVIRPLKAGIKLLRLGFEPERGWTYRGEGGEISPMCETIGHRPNAKQSSFGNSQH